MSGTQISTMTPLAVLPDEGAVVPVVKAGEATNYAYDIAAKTAQQDAATQGISDGLDAANVQLDKRAYTATTLADLKAAPINPAGYIFAPPNGSDGGAAAGTFLYQTAGAPYTADGVNIIALNAVPLTTGALVRQAAAGIAAQTQATGAVVRPQQSKNDDVVSVFDFMTASDRAACQAFNPQLGWSSSLPDVTYAFNAAQAASEHVLAPAGGYKLENLRMLNRRQITGDGKNATFFLQKVATSRIIDCLSDASVGQLLGVKISGVSMLGCPNPTAAAVRVAGYSGYAVTRSWFEYHAQNVAKFIEVQPGDTGTNVYDCDFLISGEQAYDDAVTCGGGVYQRWKLFLTRCEKYMAVMDFGHSHLDIVGDGCIKIGGQGNYVRPSIEFIWATRLPEDNPSEPSTGAGSPSRTVIDMSQTIESNLVQPLLNTYASNVANPDTRGVKFAIRAGQGLTIYNLRIYGSAVIQHPFDPSPPGFFTIVNGRSDAQNKMETLFNEENDGLSLRRVSFIGDTSSLATVPTSRNALDPLRVTPGGPINLSVGMRYTSIVIDPTVTTVDFINFSIKSAQAPYDGWYLAISTTKTITTINWPTDGRYSNLPTTLAANSRFAMQFNAAANKWFLA